MEPGSQHRPIERVVASIAIAIAAAAAPAGASEIPFAAGWELSGPSIAVVDGVLEAGNGRAVRREARLQDGTISFDLQLSGARSFVFLELRAEDDESYEEIYFRAHKSNLPDAVQYAPVFHGISPWQLYHGEGYTAPAPLAAGPWIHVRVMLRGGHAAVFVGEGARPVLIVPLVREPRAGYVALRASTPPGGPGPWSARFNGFELDAAPPSFDATGVEPRAALPGTITTWNVSETFVPAAGSPVQSLPAGVVAGAWSALSTEASGLLLLSRDRGAPPGADQWAVLARTTIEADRELLRRLELGWSDEVSVFLNGRLLFAADASYSFDRPRREGLIGFEQAALYLPLRRGANELVLAVTDRFGGWGWMARLP